MKRVMMVILATVLLVGVAAVLKAEMAKEGSGDYVVGKAGTLDMLPLGEKRWMASFEEFGIFTSAPADSPFVNATYRCKGTMQSIQANKWTGNGAMAFTLPNGDQIFGVIETMEGVLGEGAHSGFVKLLGGTGSCAGIEGRLDFAPRPKSMPSQKGTYQLIGLGKVSWKIP